MRSLFLKQRVLTTGAVVSPQILCFKRVSPFEISEANPLPLSGNRTFPLSVVWALLEKNIM